MNRHAVISGAGIAGPALAHQLAQTGWQTTVVERFDRQRDEGHNVDVRGAAREVVRRMGIEDEIRAANTTEIGMRFVRSDGSPAASFPMAESGGDGPTAELEILRGELSRILIEHTTSTTDYRFGTQIVDLIDHGDRVTAALNDGESLDADLIVIAEGLRSRTRDLVLPTAPTDLGMYIAYLTIARDESDDRWWNWRHVPGSRAIHLRPDNIGSTRAMLSFMSDVKGLEDLDRGDQIAILRRTFADAGGVAQRILAQIEHAPMYFDALGQIRAPQWSAGRIALLGDAAFCPSPVGGGGSSLALIGAYVLAGELSRHGEVSTALAGYERFMRPHVDAAQRVRPAVLRVANPRTRSGIRGLHAAARLIASPPVRTAMGLAGKTFGGIAAEKITLPRY
ncbi:FAD-dependent monooxygenase [Candidatus Mycobacterium wuenschmannii]|uniref:FAD-dependent monooxygenase n=1 Tax=Candidatus Mycobacterium wuenschmannii TaxID=3027808 RepID=A0ABY8VXZ2_9MYCO|nr:FAD-dependent monooxygenase [Candidatus Mycobacterium wuenschmannii]WIM88504.1 FAD-dependent monooxygenase [Candidatus Mycobacterium wuenschmannii]